jgi:phage gpG-like protein
VTKVLGLPKLKRSIGKMEKAMKRREMLEILMKGGLVFERGGKLRVRGQGLIDTGNLRAGLQARQDPAARLPTIATGPTTVYAAIHEFGGITEPNVTPRMRGFAWWKFKTTGESMWKALALTRKKKLSIRIPARPYMRPTFDEDGDKAERAILRELKLRFRRLFPA